MLRDAGAHFGLGCGGASVADMLVIRTEPTLLALSERLMRMHQPVEIVLAGRKTNLHALADRARDEFVVMPLRIGAAGARLHLSAGLIDWLAQPLGLEGALIDEEPLQRALLLELVSLDFIRQLETHVDADIRFGEYGEEEPLHALDMALEADGAILPLRIELTERHAEKLADLLDRLQPPEPADHSDLAVDLVVEAGSQDLSIEELHSLRPGDVVMLASHRPVAVAGGKIVAPVRRQADGVELDGPFYPRSSRPSAGSRADIQSGSDARHLVHLIAETARVTTTVGVIDTLKPRQALPLSCFDETGVDLVVDSRRFGRGEMVMIGAGLGVRIVSLLPAAADSQIS